MDLDIGKKLDKIKLNFQETADPRSLGLLERISSILTELTAALRAVHFNLPSIFKVQGVVTVDQVDRLPSIEIKNFSDLGAYFEALRSALGSQQTTVLAAIKALETFKKSDQEFKLPDVFKIEGFQELLDSQEQLKKGFNLLINKETGVAGPMDVKITNWQPQMKPQPVTNVNINPLRGYVETSAITVITTATPLPGTSLANRRGVIVFNNDATKTLYVGGSDVTALNGLPVLAQNYSPVMDAGPRMLVYGVVDSGSVNARVLELSNDASGGSY